MPKTITDCELLLSFGYAPKLRDASLDWLDCDDAPDIGSGVGVES